ncbi:hypothetical protein OED01_07685 [Microbacterium sp. M28]|uniref:hypothetical protein n=1 Tax=Microbacterium sp. M28 TaxID=2962064 RepID=UPI0021F4C6C4|nr:hypothetical protein [Microbacterium sp. M28]UYO98576.1 hypothetical protein OED01_07685 [Microbacterium sp. M28]
MNQSRLLPSPRTSEEPMAFTRDEFSAGALRSWALFVGLFVGLFSLRTITMSGGAPLAALGFVAVVSGWVALLCAAISAIGLVVLMPALWLVARSLRRERRIVVHAVVYVLVGIGVAAGAAALAHFFADGILDLTGITAVAAAVAVPVGWWLTARRALLRDRGIISRRRRRTRVDPDMLAEDTALG